MSRAPNTTSNGWWAPIAEILRQERERTSHLGPSHYLGALTLVFLFVQLSTGILLMLYYRPSALTAYTSTAIITDEVRLGWLVRSLHHWGSDLLILLVLLHLLSSYFSRTYQAPRHFTWMLGLVLLVLVLTLGFTGILLPWDQYAYWYMDSARATISSIPVLGTLILGFIWGGWELGSEVLLRFYALHIGMLPWLLLAVLFLHGVLVWRLGIKLPAPGGGAPVPAGTPIVPDFVANLFMAVLLIGGFLLTAAVIAPAGLLEPADPLVPLSGVLPPWYLRPVRELIQSLGGIGSLAIAAFTVLLFLVPVLDRHPLPSTRSRFIQRALGILLIAACVVLGAKGCQQ